jgi:hypothetical protein
MNMMRKIDWVEDYKGRDRRRKQESIVYMYVYNIIE